MYDPYAGNFKSIGTPQATHLEKVRRLTCSKLLVSSAICPMAAATFTSRPDHCMWHQYSTIAIVQQFDDGIHLDWCFRIANLPTWAGACNEPYHRSKPLLFSYQLPETNLNSFSSWDCFHFLKVFPPYRFSWLLALSAMAPTMFVST